MIALVPVKQPQRIWINLLHDSNKSWIYNHKKTKYSKMVNIFDEIYFSYAAALYQYSLSTNLYNYNKAKHNKAYVHILGDT